MNVPFSPRTAECEARYQSDKALGRTRNLRQTTPIHVFRHWVLINNDYPYDGWFETHHMLIPIRDVASREELNVDELRELKVITEYFIEPNYDVILDNTRRKRSVQGLYHIHLGVYKEER